MAECLFAFLCDRAVKGDGLRIDAVNVGVDHWQVSGFPAAGTIDLVVKIAFETFEAESSTDLIVAFENPAGVEMSNIAEVVLPDWDGTRHVQHVFTYPFEVESTGRHHFVVRVAGVEVTRVPLDIRD